MRDHDDKLILGYLLENIHYLHGGIGVQRAGRLIRQKYIRVVHEGARNGDALHLPAGHLVGLFIYLLSKADLFKRVYRACPAFSRGDAGKRQRKLNI